VIKGTLLLRESSSSRPRLITQRVVGAVTAAAAAEEVGNVIDARTSARSGVLRASKASRPDEAADKSVGRRHRVKGGSPDPTDAGRGDENSDPVSRAGSQSIQTQNTRLKRLVARGQSRLCRNESKHSNMAKEITACLCPLLRCPAKDSEARSLSKHPDIPVECLDTKGMVYVAFTESGYFHKNLQSTDSSPPFSKFSIPNSSL
jgi:hypothetical protein